MAGGHGLCPSEAQVLDLWDDGLSIDGICAATGLKQGRVANLVRYYGETAPDFGHKASVVEANARFIDAMRRVYPARFIAVVLADDGAGAGLV